MIGWYVHHVGAGHLTRARAIAAHLRTDVTGLSSLPRPEGWTGDWVRLARDDARPPTSVRDPTAGGTLHWVPEHDDGLRARTAAVVAWVAAARPELLVVDVSVEVALTARLCGVPVVVVAMPGDRRDRAHATAYDLADHLLAPWPDGAHDGGWPQAWLDKTWHVGGLSRFDGRARTHRLRAAAPPSVLVLWGRGGRSVTADDVRAAAQASAGWTWRTVGPEATMDDVWEDLCAATVVVTHAGQNAVAEVAAAGRPAVVVAQPRPHEEQLATAAAVDRLGLAVGLSHWPDPGAWPALLAQAVRRGGDWTGWHAGGAAHAARLLDQHLTDRAGAA